MASAEPPADTSWSVATGDDRTVAAAALVLDITTAAAGELDLDAILRAALDRLGAVISFTGGSIALVAGDDLVIRAAVGPFADEALGHRLARGPSRSWAVVDGRSPIRIDDLHAVGLRTTGAKASGAVRSWLAVPIERHGVGVGLLEVDSTEPGAFDDDDAGLLATVARALAGPIDLAARYDDERRQREVRDAFIGIVSHELRTPITTIYGMSRVLRQRASTMPPAEVELAIEDIEAEADRLRRLTEDLLVLSRAEGGRLELGTDPIVVGHVVRRAAEGEAARAPRHQVSVTIEPALPLVLGEDLYLEQVVRNLVGNAIKYSPAGGPVDVSAVPADGGVTIRVRDRGPGLPDVPVDRLFELYYRTPDAIRSTPGAGIGLFVCAQLVAAMGGRIDAASADGGGAVFEVWLPGVADGDPE